MNFLKKMVKKKGPKAESSAVMSSNPVTAMDVEAMPPEEDVDELFVAFLVRAVAPVSLALGMVWSITHREPVSHVAILCVVALCGIL